MVAEYAKPMLDVGSPRVFNCNVLTRRVFTKDVKATPFFRNKVLNNLVLIKDALPDDQIRSARSAIGTKLYFPFNEKDIYEGGRTIFVHDKHLEQALIEQFGQGAIAKEALDDDMKALRIFDRLPSLDPFLLKDVFLNEGITIHEGYFEVGQEIWHQIEMFILERFEPVAKAAFPDALASDDKARKLIEKIWEARDIEALSPLIAAFRLPPTEALEIFSAWKGVNFYAFEYERVKPKFIAMLTWLNDTKIPMAAVSAQERTEVKNAIEQAKTQLRMEWQGVDKILGDYQSGYDKMFKLKTSSTDFVNFLRNSSKVYWALGNSLGKVGQGSYCWDLMTKRFPERKLPWENLREISTLLAKIFKPEAKPASAVSW